MKKLLIASVMALLLTTASATQQPSSRVIVVGDIGEPAFDGKSLRVWAELCKDPDAVVRRRHILALSQVVWEQWWENDRWEGAAHAFPVFCEALKDPDADVRAKATKALYYFGLGPDAEAQVARLLKKLQDKDASVRWYALADLEGSTAFLNAYESGTPPPAAKTAIPTLIRVLRDDPDAWVREQAAIDLGWLGPDGKDAVPTLANLLKQHPWEKRVCVMKAAIALGRIGPDSESAIPTLREALKHQWDPIRYLAASALGDIGPRAKVAAPDLKMAMQDERREVCARAAVSLWQITKSADEPLPVLIEALEGKDKDIDGGPIDCRTVARSLKTLGEMAAQARKAVPLLVDLLSDEEPRVRQAAAEAFMKIDRDAAKKAGIR